MRFKEVSGIAVCGFDNVRDRHNEYKRDVCYVGIRLIVIVFISVMFLCFLHAEPALALTEDNNDPQISYVDDIEFCMTVSEMSQQYGSDGDDIENNCASKLLIVCDEIFDCSELEGLEEAVFNDYGLCVMQFDSTSNAKKAYYELKEQKNVLSVEFDSVVHADYQYANEHNSSAKMNGHLSWGVSSIGADVYSEYLKSTGYGNMTVAVVDTGADLTHPFLKSRLMGGYDFARNDAFPDDEDGHGTHVIGTIADCTLGMNDIKIMPVKILDDEGEGSLSDIGNGVIYAAENGASVINLSVGGYHSAFLDVVIRKAIRNGVIIVAAAGNEGMNINRIKACPAHMNELITVGAVDKYLSLESYSNYGEQVDVVAPGTDVNSSYLNHTYEILTGTSMATPHVTACAAMLKLKYPAADCAQIESILKRSCNDIKGTSRDGSGVINMKNLLADVSAQTARPLSEGYVYTGRSINAEIEISRNGERLLMGPDYSVTYKNNVKIGTATAIINGEGSYYGTREVSFKIVPKGTGILSIKPAKNGFLLKWKKQQTKTDGYQIQYSLKKSFKDSKIRTIKGNKKVTCRKTNLKSGKKYYVRVRTYKLVNGKKYCSSWSKTKSVKTK